MRYSVSLKLAKMNGPKSPSHQQNDGIERKKNKAIDKNDFAEASRLCNSAGELLSNNGLYSEAVEWHKEEVNCSEAANDILGAAIGHRKIGECLCELSEFEEALKHQKKHLKLSQSVGNQVEEQRALATIGRTLFVSSDSCEREMDRERSLRESLDAYLRSLSVVDKLRELVKEKEILEMRARLCLNLGLVYEWRNQLDQAEKFMEKALISSRENGLKDNMYRCYLSLSGVTTKSQKFQESLRYAKKAQHLATEKSNKIMEADAVLQLGQIFTKLGEFTKALKLIRQSYKLNPPALESDRESLLETLKLAVHGEKYTEKLKKDLNDEERLPLVEKLGDIYGEAKSSAKALECYQQQLDLTRKLNRGSRALASVYVSLAITHSENGDVEKALEYYRKELEIRKAAGFTKDFKETCATYSAIAKLLEDSGCEKERILEAYSKAVENGEKSESISCQLRVYKELSQTLLKFGQNEENEAVEKKIRKLERENHEIDEEDSQNLKEEENETMEDLEELLLSSESEDEENETGYNRKTAASARRRRKKLNKTNEKGETPLHVACISGNVEKVKELLETGASVHCRDFCGWQPLHEACNFGYLDVAKLLLVYGANVNDSGGDHCGHVTPLHDAAQNGHLEMVQFLVKNHANTHARDSKGRTPYDMVDAAIKADEEELEGSESDVLQSRREVRRYLKREMMKTKPEPQLRSRNVLDQFRDDERRSSDDEEAIEIGLENLDRRKKAKRLSDEAERLSGDRISSETYGKRKSGYLNSTAVGHHANRQDESFEMGGKDDYLARRATSPSFEKKSSNISGINDNSVFEAMETNDEFIDLSMDEEGLIDHSPIKPLEPLGSDYVDDKMHQPLVHNRPQTSNITQEGYPNDVTSSSYNQTTNHEINDLTDRHVAALTRDTHATNEELIQQQLQNTYRPNVEDITHFTSGSDSDDVELIDGFIVNDVGQKQAPKKRRIENDSRKKKVVQRRITVPGQLHSSSRTKLNPAERGSKSSVKLSRPKPTKQARITYESTAQNTTPNRSFTVNNGSCSSTNAANRRHHSTVQKQPSAASNSRNGTSPVNLIHDFCQQNQQASAFSQPVSSALRIRVRVEKELLLIPCVDHDGRKTIKWLADQASQRYSSSTGLTPKLSLKTKEGALLCENDFISDVLMNNEEVIAAINEWDTGSICEKYGRECAVLGMEQREDVIQVLSLEESLTKLSMKDFNLDYMHVKAISKALAGHSKLCRIDLTGNYLDDTGVEYFSSSIKYLPSLTSLKLSCTGMTSNGFATLSKGLASGLRFRNADQINNINGHPLEELDCSYNSFENSVIMTESLMQVSRSCPKLSKLILDHCFFSPFLFSLTYPVSFKGCKNLKIFSYAGNVLANTEATLKFFVSLPTTIQVLNISGCFPHEPFAIQEVERKMISHLCSYVQVHRSSFNLEFETLLESICHVVADLWKRKGKISGCFKNSTSVFLQQCQDKQAECSLSCLSIKDLPPSDSFASFLTENSIVNYLQRLDMSGFSIAGETLNATLRCIASLKSLTELDISGNANIDTTIAQELLQYLAAYQSPLSSLKMTSCGIRNLTEEFLSCCEVCSNLNYLDLSFNEICRAEKKTLVDWWRIVYQNAETCIDHDWCVVSTERTNFGWTGSLDHA